MLYFLYATFFISCLVLIATVLLQPGKSDAGALFTSSVSSTAFGPRGTQSVLSRVTIGAAIVFMLTALLISLPVFSGNNSILNSQPESVQQSQAPVSIDSNSNVAPANTNVPAAVTETNSAVNGNVNR